MVVEWLFGGVFQEGLRRRLPYRSGSELSWQKALSQLHHNRSQSTSRADEVDRSFFGLHILALARELTHIPSGRSPCNLRRPTPERDLP